MADWIIITGITVVYLVFVLGVGLAARGREYTSQAGYVAGGRQLGLVLLFFIMGSEVFSAFAFLGGPSWAYTKGAPALYLVAYLTLGVGVWWAVGPRLRRLSADHGHLTQADLIAGHFQSRLLSPAIALVSVAALVPYLAIQITGAGLLFQAATEGQIPFWLGALAAFVVVTVYVYTSGLRGIGWTSLVQGMMMVAVAWFLGLAVADRLFGGVQPMFEQIAAQSPQYLTIPGGGAGMNWAAFSSAIIVSGLGGIMWPHLFMKFYTARSDRTIKQMTLLYPLYAYLLVPLLLIGFAGVLVFADAPLADPDRVLLQIVVHVANFSPWVIGIMLSGALAAAMSTGANLAHSAATITARDLIGTLFARNACDAAMVRLTRAMLIVICALAYGVSLLHLSSLVTMLLSAYGVIVQLLPLTLALLFWSKASRAGAYAGLISGALVTLLFTFGPSTPFDIHAGLWGLAANTVALVGISLMMPATDTAAAHAPGRQATATD